MDLWVRSQNKHTLSNIKSVHINEDNDNNCVDVMGVYSIWNITYLGTYKTKERALEIIDEIQDLMRSLTDSDLKIIQYEMPKE